MKQKQLKLLKNEPLAHGGTLRNTRSGRFARPLDTKNTMHLVLRSSKATKDWSFKRPKNERKIAEIVAKFSVKYGVKIVSMANVGNHLHFQIKLATRFGYKPFIRAVTSAIAMKITGLNRWTAHEMEKLKFWDYRPFTRVVLGFKAFLKLKDYIQINEIEGFGPTKIEARFIQLRLNTQFPLRP